MNSDALIEQKEQTQSKATKTKKGKNCSKITEVLPPKTKVVEGRIYFIKTPEKQKGGGAW